jgi:tetratricopeptide (TPR) repeat protein
VESRAQPPAPDTRFTILLADLAGDDAALTETFRLSRALTQSGGFEVRLIGRELKPSSVGSVRESDARNAVIGRQWLKELNGDLLVWGQVLGSSLVLSFVSQGDSPSELMGYARLGERLDLPREMVEALSVQVEAIALSLVPHVDEEGRDVLVTLEPVAAKLEDLLKSSGRLRSDTRSAVANALGLTALALGQRGGSENWTAKAVESFHTSVALLGNEVDPRKPARVQTNLGVALGALADARGDMSLMRESIRYHRQAAQAFPDRNSGMEWALMQNNLGRALMRLSEIEGDPTNLEEAIKVHRSTLQVFGRDSAWMELWGARINLGNALTEMGEMKGMPRLIEEGISEYRRALGPGLRDAAPMRWAMVQNNLGAALVELGELQRTLPPLHDAVIAYRSVLEVFTRDRAPLRWAMAKHNLGSTLGSLGSMEKNSKYLEESISAHRQSLLEYNRERDPFEWAMARVNLGLSLTELGIVRRDVRPVKEAVQEIRFALEVYLPRHAPRPRAAAHNNLAKALVTLGELESDPAIVRQGIASLDVAMAGYQEVGQTQAVAETRRNRVEAVRILGRVLSRHRPRRAMRLFGPSDSRTQAFKGNGTIRQGVECPPSRALAAVAFAR